MVAFSSIAAVVGIAGLGVQAVSAVGQASARREATAASRRAERLREQQMNLERARKQREAFRQATVARSVALSRSVSQGAGQGDEASSSLFGAYGQIAGAFGRATNTEEQNADIGAGLFAANRDLASAQGDIATYEGIGKLGSSLTANSETIGKIGNSIATGSLFGPSVDYRNNTSGYGDYTY